MNQDEIEAIRLIPDAIERARAVGQAQERLLSEVEELSHIRREAVDELLGQNMRQIDIAKALGLSKGRLNKMVRTGPGPERAILAPSTTSAGTLVTVAWAEKPAPDSRSAIIVTTHDAHLKLDRLAAQMNLKTQGEAIPEGGVLDLNRDNLIVMIGPRITPVIAQAIGVDPAIKWRYKGRADGKELWCITDPETGKEYHSDFDDRGVHQPSDRRTCYAHIGRIRRPDGQGSFLYLGGIHAPGTAGAVDVLCRELPSIWEQAHRGLWSAVVKTVASGDGSEIVSAEIVTPIYTHGKGR